MRITVVGAEQLTSDQLAVWSRIQRADPALASPCFRPELVEAVASVRPGVSVAVLEEEGQPCGFFAFQRGRWGIGRPVGHPLSDFHGVVARPDARWNVEDLVRASGLSAWHFDHLLACQPPFQAYHRAQAPSPFIDVSDGFEAYQIRRRQAGSREISRIAQSARTAERAVGPLRFVFHTDDHRVLQTLIRWKAEQYRRSRHTNIFALAWVVRLLELVRRWQSEAFSGVLSALYLGERLAAVHLGMRSYDVLHYWFPAYDPELSRHSPGRICLLEIVKAAASQGIRRIDLGKGSEPYKVNLMSGSTAVAEGTVSCSRLGRALDETWERARGMARLPVLGLPVRLAVRLSRPLRRWLTIG